MARYHFRLVSDDALRTLVTADLDNFEEIEERAELLAHLLLLTEDDWYAREQEMREIVVHDEHGQEVLSLPLSSLRADGRKH